MDLKGGYFMKKVLSIVFFIIAIISIVGAITAKGSGFLDLSNIGRYILIGIAIICVIVAVICWRKK